jgi:secretion/DNA translocation related TadE-like protein
MTRRGSRSQRRTELRDAGSATIWVLACVLLILSVLTITLVRTAAVLARHRAESAADLAALAAAGRIGASGSPCAAAGASAERNRARLASCDVALGVGGRSGTVVVRVSAAVTLPVVGVREVSASARAGRLPPSRSRAATGTSHLFGGGFGTWLRLTSGVACFSTHRTGS